MVTQNQRQSQLQCKLYLVSEQPEDLQTELTKKSRLDFYFNGVDNLLSHEVQKKLTTLNIRVSCAGSSFSTSDTGLADKSFPVEIIALATYTD